MTQPFDRDRFIVAIKAIINLNGADMDEGLVLDSNDIDHIAEEIADYITIELNK